MTQLNYLAVEADLRPMFAIKSIHAVIIESGESDAMVHLGSRGIVMRDIQRDFLVLGGQKTVDTS